MKKDEQMVKKLEFELLRPEVRKNKKRLDELLVDDFCEFTSVGTVIHKKDVLKNLPKEKDIKWQILNLKTKTIFENAILVTYKVKKTNLKNKKTILSLRNSIWKNDNGNWQIIFHQGTQFTNH